MPSAFNQEVWQTPPVSRDSWVAQTASGPPGFNHVLGTQYVNQRRKHKKMIPTKPSESPPKTPPIKRFKAGCIQVAVWRNEGTKKTGEPTDYYTVTCERRFKHPKTQQWQSSHTWGKQDMPTLAVLMDAAYKYVTLADDPSRPLAATQCRASNA